MKKQIAAALAASSLLLGIPGIASADNLVADGDELAPVADNNMSFGTVCAGSTTTKTALLAVTRQGNGNVFANGAVVTVAKTGQTGAGVSAVMDSSTTITLPSNWTTSANGTASTTVGSTVTLVAGSTAGTISGSVSYSATGTDRDSTVTPLVLRDTMNVTATVSTTGSCAPPPPAPTNTAPTVSVAGVTNGASYNKGSVPVATCTVTDAEDGPSSFAATLSGVTGTYSTDGIGSQTASCAHTDSGGLAAVPASATYSIVDPTAPGISSTVNPTAPDGLNGWYKSNVSLTWTVSEPESPNSLQKTGCANQNITTDQAATSYSCSATSAGGSAGPVTVSIKRDGSAPGAPSFDGGPVNGTTYYTDDVIPGAPTCSAVDVGPSGIASCMTSGHSTAFGTHTISGTATDNAGNETTGTGATYTIARWTSVGYYSPVRMGTDVMNSVKGGSTVPLKFELFKGATEITSTTGIGYRVEKYTCDGSDAVVADLALETTGSTQLRYDTTDGQFIQNWKTPTTKGCYRAIVTPPHGAAPLVAQFQVR